MKELIALIAFVALVAFVPPLAFAGGEIKKVCRMERNKQGTEVPVCKTIKVHKKLEGKKVPGQK
jgi:hypothetical protein